jgi:hypothetical protein
MFRSSATRRHREQTLPEALGLRQAVHPRDDTAGSAAVRRGQPGAKQPTEPQSRAQPGCGTRIRELTAYAATGDRPRTRSDSRSSGVPNRREGAHITAAVSPAGTATDSATCLDPRGEPAVLGILRCWSRPGSLANRLPSPLWCSGSRTARALAGSSLVGMWLKRGLRCQKLHCPPRLRPASAPRRKT